MKSGHVLAPLILALALLVPTVSAQPYAPRNEGVSYGYASVLRVTPVYEDYRSVDQQPCYDGDYQPRHKDTTGATVLGAIVGGALGNQVGKGDGRKAATVAGAVAGGAIGHNIAKNSDDGYYENGPCRSEVSRSERNLAGYDVEYSYKGDVYVARMSYDPGDRIRVRVSVVPAENGPPPPYRR